MSMSDGTTLSIKRSITVRAVVTPAWKEEAERELSNAIATSDQQLAQLEQEGQQVVEEIRRQSANPLDPRVQEQVAQVQQQVAAKRAELEEQKRNVLQQQAQVRELAMEQIVEQGQIESFCDLKVGDNLVTKMQVAVVVRDGVVESIEQG
jgi:multidrug efflux pump subunit AcrA (membrane-fusion protein)